MYKEIFAFIEERCPKDALASDVAHLRNLKVLKALPNSALCAFIVDFANKRIFSCADEINNGCGKTWDDWNHVVSDSIPVAEREKMCERIASVQSFVVNEIPIASRHKVTVYEDFHISMMGMSMLVTQKFIPVDIDARGNVTVGMFVIMPSANNSFGNMSLFHDGRVWTFNKRTQSFIERKMKAISDSEMKMMVLSRKGFTVESIAERLSISVDSVKTLRKRVYKKLGADGLQKALSIMDNYSLWRVW